MDPPNSSGLNNSYKHKNEINKKKIQRDLNSPSASVRLRAIKSLKSPTKSSYNFDIPHDMQNIISDEERTYKPLSLAEIMKDVIVYVEMYSDGFDVSINCREKISEFGIKVNERFLKNTTHLVFKEGKRATYNKAKKMGIPIVTVLWIEECRKVKRVVDPELFKISDWLKYENPEYYRRLQLQERKDRMSLTPIKKIRKIKKNLNSTASSFALKSIDTSEDNISSGDSQNFNNLTPKCKKPASLMKAVLLKNCTSTSQMQRGYNNKKTENDTINENNLKSRKTISITDNMEQTLLAKDINAHNQGTSRSYLPSTLPLDNSELFSSSSSSSSSLSPFVPIKTIQKRRQTTFLNRTEMMEETLINNENNIETATATQSIRKKRKHTVYDRKSLDVTSTENEKNQNISFLNNDDNDNDENLQPTPISTKKNISPKNLSSLLTISESEPKVKKRKLFVHDILVTPSPPSPTPPSSTSDTLIPQEQKHHYHNKDFEINLPRNFSIIKQQQHQEKEQQTKSVGKKTITQQNKFDNSKCRRSLIDFNLNKSSKLLSQQQKKSNILGIKSLKGMVCTNIGKKEQIDFVNKTIEKLGGFILEDIVTNRTTHVICFQIRRTMNLLRGMIRGLWILNYDWIIDSLKSGKWLYEEEYEIQNFSRTIQINRSQREAFGKNYRMELFESLGSIYVSEKSTISYKNIIELIILCNGKISKTKDDAKLIIGEYYNNKNNKNKENNNNNIKTNDENDTIDKNQEKICLKPEWVLDSIMNNRIKKFHKYLIKEDNDK